MRIRGLWYCRIFRIAHYIKVGPTFFVVITAWFHLKQIVMWIDVGNTAQASKGNESKAEIKRIHLISGHCLLVLGQANSSNRTKEPSCFAVLYSSWRSIKTDIRTGMVMRKLFTWELSVRVWQDEWVRVCVLRQKEVRNFFCEMTKDYLLGIQD